MSDKTAGEMLVLSADRDEVQYALTEIAKYTPRDQALALAFLQGIQFGAENVTPTARPTAT